MMNSTKTLTQILEENPNLYNSCDGYTYSSQAGAYVNTGITAAEKKLILDEFGDRYVFDDDKFVQRFINQLNYTALRYANMSRLEFTAFDPLVANYMERQILTDETNTRLSTGGNSKITTFANDYTDNRLETPDVTEEEERVHTPGVTDTNTRATTPDITEEGKRKDKKLEKSMPMSNSYPGAVAVTGDLQAFNWQNPSGQAEQDGASSTHRTGSENETNITYHDGHEDDDITRRRHGDISTSDIKHGDGNETSNEQISQSENGAKGVDSREIMTGRNGLTPQEALREAVSFLKTSNAWLWRRGELNELFKYPSYDPGISTMYF